MSRGLVMAQSIEDNIISTVFHKVKDRFGFLSEAKVRDPGGQANQGIDHQSL